MEGLLGFFLALFLSILIVPLLTRYASRVGMVDAPGGRKSHVGIVPRVGGIAFAISAAIPPLLWFADKPKLIGFIAGSSLIVIFGALDDRFNLDYRVKLLGQLAAAVVAVSFDICLYHLPFFGLDALPGFLTIPASIIFILAVTNAFNLLDGLDGLAAGCAILSLAAIAVLAFFSAEGSDVVIAALAIIGGILGFLRYNTHPAIVFMGDAGSQFLGFSIATISIVLLEHTLNAMSPAVVLLLLGLPVLDTCMVMFVRVRQGRSPFSPDRNHIHHKLLSIGLKHYQAVAVIYAIQALIVGTAFVVRFESDALVLFVYVAVCGTAITGYFALKYALARLPRHVESGWTSAKAVHLVDWRDRLSTVATRYVEWSIAGYMIVGSISARSTPIDVSLLALGLVAFLIGSVIVSRQASTAVTRLAAYLIVIYVSYGSVMTPTDYWLGTAEFVLWLCSIFFALALLIVLAPKDRFRLTTLDLLIVLVVIGALWIPIPWTDHRMTINIIIRSVVFLYACEVLLEVRQNALGPVGLAAVISLFALSAHSI